MIDHEKREVHLRDDGIFMGALRGIEEGYEYQVYRNGKPIGKALRIHDQLEYSPIQELNQVILAGKLTP